MHSVGKARRGKTTRVRRGELEATSHVAVTCNGISASNTKPPFSSSQIHPSKKIGPSADRKGSGEGGSSTWDFSSSYCNIRTTSLQRIPLLSFFTINLSITPHCPPNALTAGSRTLVRRTSLHLPRNRAKGFRAAASGPCCPSLQHCPFGNYLPLVKSNRPPSRLRPPWTGA